MPIDITDDRERANVILPTKDKHAFYERFGFQAEREMAMILRR